MTFENLKHKQSFLKSILSLGLLPLALVACQPVDSQAGAQLEDGEWREASSSEFEEFTDNQNSHGILLPSREGFNHGINTHGIKVPTAVMPAQIDSQAEQTAARFQESLETSQARLAAYRPDLCPKLLTTEVDSKQIIRTQEILKGEYCDYFLYPLKGQTITVASKPDSFRAFLVSPINHDFLNGSYQVQQSDKHIIRLTYEGSDVPIDPLHYDIDVTVD